MQPIMTVMSIINTLQQAYNANLVKGTLLTKKDTVAQGKNAAVKSTGMFAGIVSAFSEGGIPGVIAGIAIATALIAALAVGITVAVAASGGFSNTSATDKAADSVNKLSNEIYKLQEKANAIKTIEKQYDALDKKIIQTAEDQQKMNELLDSAGDKLSSENEKDGKGKEKSGTSEKDIYSNLQSEKARREYLTSVEKKATDEANQKRREQIKILGDLTDEQRKAMLLSKDNADNLMAQDAIYAINNNTLYQYLDTLENVGDGVEKLTQNILEQMDAEQAYQYAKEASGAKIKSLADTINSANKTIGDSQVSLAEILDSTKYSIAEKIEAYNELYKAIDALGDDTLSQSFEEAYGQ